MAPASASDDGFDTSTAGEPTAGATLPADFDADPTIAGPAVDTTAVMPVPTSPVPIPALAGGGPAGPPGWESDAARAPATTHVIIPPTPGPGRPGWLRRHLALITVVVVLTAALAGLAVNDNATHNQLASTRRHLNITAADLGSTQSTLNTTQSQLASTQSQLTSTKSDLAAANSAKDSLQSQLGSSQQQLSGVQNTLSSTQNQLNLQSGQLSILKTCLSGVMTAFSSDLNSDYTAALAALNSVQSACQSAFHLING